MKRVKYVGVGLIIVVLIAVLLWWMTLGRTETFLHHASGELSWFDISIQKDKFEGKLHHHKIMEEPGQVPYIEEMVYSMKGEKVSEAEYELVVYRNGGIELYQAKLKDGDLSIQLDGENSKIYTPVQNEELQTHLSELQEEFDNVMYHAEYKEDERIRKFFNEFRSPYGYLYTNEDQTLQMLIKIDEALLEGEVSGSLLMMKKIGDTYTETTYELNGITDGLMIRLYMTVDGEDTILAGNFYDGNASNFDLSLWETDEKVVFHAVTEEEYNQHYEEFKR
jgi:hypothetical protein